MNRLRIVLSLVAFLALCCWGAGADRPHLVRSPIPPQQAEFPTVPVAMPEAPADFESSASAATTAARRPNTSPTRLSFNGIVLDHRGAPVVDYVLSPGWSIFT